jgi:LmbE family N-acetylglucosaminyl deacetylase
MRVLVVAPHADDETIGVGGTIARHAAAGDEVTVAVMTGHGEEAPHPIWPRDAWNVVRAELRESCAILGVREVVFKEIPAVGVVHEPLWRLTGLAAEIVAETRPEVMYVPFLFDLHKDHRELFHAFSVTWRPHLPLGRSVREVYAYETLTETHLNFPYAEQGFLPNTWVDISLFLETKLKAMAAFKTQVQPHPGGRSLEAARALAVWRGSQTGVAAAEAFCLVRKLG